eukprot:m.41405 g.41405  ORF g.41405 m.41405 type:complete len:247 (-) comp10422_c0_seq1:184-924(-)
MNGHEVVSREEWMVARLELLRKEKEFTKLRDELNKQRREMPWVAVEEDYTFTDGKGDEVKLGELFKGKSQLIVYHFMFASEWDEGCSSCSFWADSYDKVIAHLNHRDINLVTVSKAPVDKINAFKQRMGWSFQWVSSQDSKFNSDFGVSFTNEQLESGENIYNYNKNKFPCSEAPGVSVFFRDPDSGCIYHTYSTYARGLDMLNSAYHLMDITPKGRDEGGLSYSMAWLKHHDKYTDDKDNENEEQ